MSRKNPEVGDVFWRCWNSPNPEKITVVGFPKEGHGTAPIVRYSDGSRAQTCVETLWEQPEDAQMEYLHNLETAIEQIDDRLVALSRERADHVEQVDKLRKLLNVKEISHE